MVRGVQITLRISVLLVVLLASWVCHGAAQTMYAVVIGNQKYVVGSSTLHSGLFMSRDTGRSWTHLGPENLKAYAMDGVDASHGRILYIAAGNGVHKSTDYGATWRIMTGWRMREVMNVLVDQRQPRWVYAATAFGFWRSSDAGEHWENPPGPVQQAYTYAVDIDAGTGNLVVSEADGLRSSADHGVTWSRETPLRTPRGVYFGSRIPLIASGNGPIEFARWKGAPQAYPLVPSAPDIITYAIANTYASTYAVGEHGVWWATMVAKDPEWHNITDSLPNHVVHAVAVLGDQVVIGTFGDGIFRRVDLTWVPSGLEGSQVWSLKVKPW